LASAAGNAVEVMNAVRFLTGSRDKRLEEVTLALAAEMLVSAGLAKSSKEGLSQAQQALDGGKAADVFARMVSALGGPSDFMEKAAHYLPQAPVIRAIAAPAAGFVSGIETRAIGVAVVALGGGRTRPQDPVDHAVGLTGLAPIGASLEKGDPIAIVHARTSEAAEAAAASVLAAYAVSARKPDHADAVIRRITV
jgi:thymidine phosphorylase